MKHLAVVVDWYGPYPLDAALMKAKSMDRGLYLGLGKIRCQRGPARPQYIGLTTCFGSRLGNHHKLPSITQKPEFWLGVVATVNVPGKATKKTPPSLDYAEWVHAYFLNLPLNERKKKNPPSRPVTVLNRWWRTDSERQRFKRPNQAWPDLIDYQGREHVTRLVWFGIKQQKRRPPYEAQV